MEEVRLFWLATSLLFSFFFFFLQSSAKNSTMSIESLDSTIRDRAFGAIRRTGVLYEVPLPSELSGIRASVVRLRSSNLLSKGANFASFNIPPRTTTVPFVKRLVIVYQDLGNLSSSFYDAPAGYSLVAPVAGLLAYDASSSISNASNSPESIGELDLKLLQSSISITFPEVALPEGLSSTIKCASFGPNGSARLADATSKSLCYAMNTGYFTMVVPSMVVPGQEVPAAAKNGENKWIVWMVAGATGVVGITLVGLVGMGVLRLARNKKMKEMEGQAEEGEALDAIWIGGSKMPSAAMTRTPPAIENGIAS